ncbi:hypothetical protein Mapa_004761 [Marchantia paleacea]|nr:hypothetical protein Mapa_004761 [Marchantia paleacea]
MSGELRLSAVNALPRLCLKVSMYRDNSASKEGPGVLGWRLPHTPDFGDFGDYECKFRRRIRPWVTQYGSIVTEHPRHKFWHIESHSPNF